MKEPKDEETKRKIANVLAHRTHKEWFNRLLAMLHLHDEDKAERFMLLLAIHMVLDRALTSLLSRRLSDPRWVPDPNTIAGTVNRVSFSQRIALAKAARLISASCAEKLLTVNKVRNSLGHWQSPEDGWGLGQVTEIASVDRFEACMNQGQAALNELMDRLCSPVL